MHVFHVSQMQVDTPGNKYYIVYLNAIAFSFH